MHHYGEYNEDYPAWADTGQDEIQAHQNRGHKVPLTPVDQNSQHKFFAYAFLLQLPLF